MVLKQKAGGQQHRLLPTGQEQQQKKDLLMTGL